MPSLVSHPAAAPLAGRPHTPADKSLSQRALILAALSLGASRIRNLLAGEDVRATAQALRACGVSITQTAAREHHIQGLGTGGLHAPDDILDFANSGTGARLMLGVMATHPHTATFTGDASLRRRPMRRVLAPLAEFGATATAREGDFLPLTLTGAREPLPIRHRLQTASAQVKSALLLAGLNAPGETILAEPRPSRDHTERMLPCFGGEIRATPQEDGATALHLPGEQNLHAAELEIPADPSSAAFLAAAALIVPRSDITIENVAVNPRRAGFYACLREMGADLAFANERIRHNEPIADIRARCGDAPALRGIAVPAERAASMIDEYPILAVVAAFAEGETRMEGLAELRVKESDRLAAVTDLLRVNGVQAESGADHLIVSGAGKPKGGGMAASHGDHRIAMSALILGLGASAPTAIDDDSMIATSFPDFPATIAAIGGEIRPG